MTVGWTDMKLESWMNIVSCRIQIWQILDFEILECGLGLVVDEYLFHGKSTPSGDKANDRYFVSRSFEESSKAVWS